LSRVRRVVDQAADAAGCGSDACPFFSIRQSTDRGSAARTADDQRFMAASDTTHRLTAVAMTILRI
jgi:hypothetical protein